MYSKTIYLVCIAAALVLGGCKTDKPKDKPSGDKTTPAKTGDKAAPRPSGDVAKQGALLREPPLWDSVAEVDGACERHLARAEALKTQLLAVKGPRTLDNTLTPFNELLLQIDRIQPTSELIANVHPQKDVRAAAEKCEARAKKLISKLKLDRGLFDALKAVPTEGLDAKAKRFVAHLLRDYRRAGVDRDEATRGKLEALQARMVKLGQKFDRTIRESKGVVEVTPAQLAGLPKDFVAARTKAAKGGKIKLTTDYPDFYPVQAYARSEALRRELYVKRLSRAYPANDKVLGELLAARHEYATTLGYPDWAQYNAEDKMAKDSKTIADFLAKVVTLARPRMEADAKQILARKRKDAPKARTIAGWDRFYYVKKIQAERFGVDPAEVRAYFDFTRVKQGLLTVAQELFGLTFKRATKAKVWHPSVEAYDVFDGGAQIARFYLDLHPREGKYGHAAEFPILSGITGVQLPSAALVTNFPDPAKTGGGPALTEHNQVTTFFHEFGHLVHQLLAGRQKWVSQSGITCEWDFVEAPSQLLEEWTWDVKVLQRFGRHHETGKPIPAELVAQMRKANEFGKGMHIMRQLFYAHLSLLLHNRDPRKLDLLAETKKIQDRFSPYPFVAKTAPHASFGHINGYSSMYYTYMWSLVVAKDLLTRFAKAGLMDGATAEAYREAILAPGGSQDAAKMVEAFLGRPYAFDAFEAYLKQG